MGIARTPGKLWQSRAKAGFNHRRGVNSLRPPHFAAWFPREAYQRIRQIMESVLNIAADVPQSQRSIGSFETMRHWSVSAAAPDIVVPGAISPASSGNSCMQYLGKR
jgi:hypothetical protein